MSERLFMVLKSSREITQYVKHSIVCLRRDWIVMK